MTTVQEIEKKVSDLPHNELAEFRAWFEKYDAIIIAVSHMQFKELGAEGIHALGKDNHVVYDIKYILSADDVDGRL